MSVKKPLPDELDEKDLIDIVENSDNFNEDKKENIATVLSAAHNVYKFISTYNLNPGKEPIKKAFLYKLYTLWSKEEVVSSLKFFYVLNDHFRSDQQFFYINKSSFSLTAQLEDLINGTVKRPKFHYGHYQKHFNKFLTESDIKLGNKWLPGYVLYSLYLDWLKKKNNIVKRGSSTFSYRNFLLFCKVYFKKKLLTRAKHHHYGVQTSIDEKIINEHWRIGKEKIENKKKKKQQKKSRKISST